MFTAFLKRALEGASNNALSGMCLRILCTPSLWGLSAMVDSVGCGGRDGRSMEWSGGVRPERRGMAR